MSYRSPIRTREFFPEYNPNPYYSRYESSAARVYGGGYSEYLPI